MAAEFTIPTIIMNIQNSPNDRAAEVSNPRYILDLLLSVINVSVQTVELVGQLPRVKFE